MYKYLVGLTISKQVQFYTCLQYKSFENTGGKIKIAGKEQFLLFPQCFLPVWRFSVVFKPEIVICKLFQFGKSLKFVVRERVKCRSNDEIYL